MSHWADERWRGGEGWRVKGKSDPRTCLLLEDIRISGVASNHLIGSVNYLWWTRKKLQQLLGSSKNKRNCILALLSSAPFCAHFAVQQESNKSKHLPLTPWRLTICLYLRPDTTSCWTLAKEQKVGWLVGWMRQYSWSSNGWMNEGVRLVGEWKTMEDQGRR